MLVKVCLDSALIGGWQTDLAGASNWKIRYTRTYWALLIVFLRSANFWYEVGYLERRPTYPVVRANLTDFIHFDQNTRFAIWETVLMRRSAITDVVYAEALRLRCVVILDTELCQSSSLRSSLTNSKKFIEILCVDLIHFTRRTLSSTAAATSTCRYAYQGSHIIRIETRLRSKAQS